MCRNESGTAAHQCDSEKQYDPRQGNTLVLISSDRLGRGDDELGSRLLVNFLKTLPEMDPWRLVLINSGVRLTADGSSAVPLLRDLVTAGVSVLACATCLDHFGLSEKQKVGETTNMVDIVTSMQVAEKIITI